jgi:hypothetical protein
MTKIMPPCPKCGRPLKKVNYTLLGWINFTGALASALFACWAGAAYALLAVGELGVSIFYFLRRDTHYVCRQCMRRYGADEVKQARLNDGA